MQATIGLVDAGWPGLQTYDCSTPKPGYNAATAKDGKP